MKIKGSFTVEKSKVSEPPAPDASSVSGENAD